MVTIKNVAEIAGVSISTVSKIINKNDAHIGKETRNRVKQAIIDSGYITNSIARSLKVKKTNTLGFILPDITNPYYAEIARGIEDAAKDHHYGVIFCNTDDNPEIEKNSIELFKSRMVDGIIFSHVLDSSAKYNILTDDIPIVVVDRTVETSDEGLYGEIYVDVAKAIYDSTIRLADSGCKKIACISAKENNQNSRYLGYCQAMKDFGFNIPDDFIYLGEFTIETGINGAKKILDLCNTVDGFVCGNDMIAVGVLDELRERNICVPQQVRVIGVDNIAFSNFTMPRLTTMEQPTYEMGKDAAKMLINFIEYGIPLTSKVFKHNLIKRETV